MIFSAVDFSSRRTECRPDITFQCTGYASVGRKTAWRKQHPEIQRRNYAGPRKCLFSKKRGKRLSRGRAGSSFNQPTGISRGRIMIYFQGKWLHLMHKEFIVSLTVRHSALECSLLLAFQCAATLGAEIHFNASCDLKAQPNE
jgi:hypothetical protein